MSKVLLVFTTILLLAGMHLPAQNPYIHHYTTFDGLPSNVINNVSQDSRKFIWFATDAGAVMYDGSTFTTFTKKDGLNSNKITKIKEDSFGRVWIINYEGSLNFYFHNKIYNSSNAAFLDSLRPSETFHDFFQDDDKTIYFHNPMYEVYVLDTNNHVKKIENLSEYLIENLVNKEGKKATGPYPKSYTNSLPDYILANLYKIKKSESGEYFFWSRRGFFQVKELFQNPVMLNCNVRSYLRASCVRDSVFYIIGFGYYIMKFKDEKLQELVQIPNYIIYSMSRGNALFRDRDGFYWVGTFDDGLYCLKEDTVILNQQYGHDNFLKNQVRKSSKIIQHLNIRQVNGIIQDHEGNIWVSSAMDGVYKISPCLNTHWHYESELFQNNGIIEMAAGLNNEVWLSNGRTIYLLKADSLYTLGFQEKNTSFNVIYHLKTNKLILGEKYSNFYIVHDINPDPRSKKVNFSRVEWSFDYISGITIYPREDKINWYNYFDFGVMDPDSIFGEHTFVDFQKVINVGSRITNTYYNLKDELIVNAKKNYIQLNDTFLYSSELSRFDNRIITQHLNLDSRTELFNIENDSLYLFQDHEFYDLTTAFATPASLNISSISYHEPVLYMANSSNIYVCNNPLDAIDNKPVNLQLIDINFKNIHKILAFNDSLYIASDDGLTVIPEAVVNDILPQKPLPYIKSVLVNDLPVDFSENKLDLKGRNSLKFTFSSISFSSTPVIYSYYLEGADKEWSSGTGNIIAYKELPFGKYVFKLKVGKPNTAWSDPVEFRVSIKPRFWQHSAFIAFVIILIIALIVLVIIRIANNKIKRQETDHQLIVLEQKALQSMMNPHFIFNSLGSIQNYLLKNKPGEAGLYLSQFARLIRQNISGIHSAMISLDEEIDRLKNYLDLERLRMENKFEYKFHLDESVEEDAVQIPSMIIQPFVENAILHGVSSLEKDGLIGISFAMASEKTIKITIEDNGIGIKQSKVYNTNNQTHLHLSMEMTRKRIHILGQKFKVETSLEISDLTPGASNPGTRVVIVLPVSFGEE